MRAPRTIALLALSLAVLTATASAANRWGLKPGRVDLKSAGAMTFGPDGILFVGDTAAGAIYALQTPEESGNAPSQVNVEGLSAQLAELLGVAVNTIKVNDLAVSPQSGEVYLTVSAGEPAQAALVMLDAAGKLSKVALDNIPHLRAVLADAPESAQGRRGNPRDDSITDLVYRDGKLLVAGLAKGESPSTVREFSFPFGEGATATNIEIFHAAHGRVEDFAVVRAFVPMVVNGEPVILAGFTCTPLVRFPLKDLQAGSKIRGTTVAELGNRNRPLDMVVYEKDGSPFVLMANSARGVMKVSLANVAENPGLTEPVKNGGTAGQPFETIMDLKGVEQLDRLGDDKAVILTKAEDGTLSLSTVTLP
jgi:hypothetical protein